MKKILFVDDEPSVLRAA